MDYFTQAKTFFKRAQDATSAEERISHIEICMALLEKVFAEQEKVGGSNEVGS